MENVHKDIYKIGLFFLKILPMLMAGLYLLNTILSYFYIDLSIISYIAGVGILPLIFLYIASYMFRFCSYHRMFLHYIVLNDILCWTDYTYELPISNWDYLVLHMIVAGVCLFLVLYIKKRDARLFKKDCCKDAQGNS